MVLDIDQCVWLVSGDPVAEDSSLNRCLPTNQFNAQSVDSRGSSAVSPYGVFAD